ncbi:hypothetical protein [Streptomyces griseus]|uniref:hypothetical protein n=1 Tax=Streptomyces griseus TaxID=1911 RepID=UPI003674A426
MNELQLSGFPTQGFDNPKVLTEFVTTQRGPSAARPEERAAECERHPVARC